LSVSLLHNYIEQLLGV